MAFGLALLLAAFLGYPPRASAQPPPESQDDAYEPPPAEQVAGARVVLVPFKNNEYFSDADQDIARASNLRYQDVRSIMRHSLDANIHKQIKKTRPVVRLLKDSVNEGMNDLEAFYNSIRYRYVLPPGVLLAQQEATKGKLFNGVNLSERAEQLLARQTKPATEPFGSGKIKVQDAATRYYAAEITNPNLIPFMAEKYKADYFVLVNQLEIRTHYEFCLDLTNQNYERELSVHFTIFDRTGKMVAGNVVTVYYPSNQNNIEEIVKENLGILALYVASNVPR